MKPEIELLKKARAILKKCGHTKHMLEDFDGRVCLNGALFKARTGNAIVCGGVRGPRTLACDFIDDDLGRAHQRICKAIGVVSEWEIVGWNNRPERTQAEVEKALTAAIAGKSL